MPYRRCRLQAGVEGVSGIDRAVTQCAADNLVAARIVIEIQLCRDMAEQMRMDSQSGVGADGSRDLRSEKRLILWAFANSGEQCRIASRRQMGPKLAEIELDQIDALRRQRALERFSVFDLFCADDDIERLAPPWPDEIPFDVEPDQIPHSNPGHQQDLDGNGQ